MKIQKLLLSAAIAGSLLVPVISQAAGLTSAQVSAIVGLLQSFNADAKTVAQVQMVLTNQKPSGEHEGGWNTGSTTWSGATSTPGTMSPGQYGKMMCIKLERNLGLGSEGDDVKKLQDLLKQDPSTGFTASSTGHFGPMTAKAMAFFQMHNGIASSTTGAVGTLTRGFFDRACGKGLDNDHMMMGSTTHQ